MGFEFYHLVLMGTLTIGPFWFSLLESIPLSLQIVRQSIEFVSNRVSKKKKQIYKIRDESQSYISTYQQQVLESQKA